MSRPAPDGLAPGPVESERPEILLRDAEERDVPAIQEIFAHHVLTGLASFEEVPPDLATMRQRFARTLELGYPYLVAVRGEQVLGYAAAGPYRPRPAYRFSVENTVYVAPGAERQGIGRRLLAALIARCEALGYRRMVAVVGDSANQASIGLHEALGFRRAGLIPSVGFKFGRWVDSVTLERPLGEGDRTLPPEGEAR